MGNGHWPYEPYDSYGRPRRRDDDDGWVVAGEEPDGWPPPPPPRNGRPERTPYYGQPAPPPQEYGQRSDPWANRSPAQQQPYQQSYQQSYQAPGDPYGGYEPQPRQYAAAYPPRQPARPAAPRTGEPDDELRPALAPALTWTIAAYLVPMLLYLGWAFTRSGTAPAGCVDASGAACPSPRVEAAENLFGVLPALVGALVLALLIALGLRRMATGWRATSIGLAAAVIGGGIATVVAAALG